MTMITVKYVNGRDGNRPPSIKGEDGNYYTIPDDKFHLYKVGQQFDAPVNEKPGKNGRSFKNIADWFDPSAPMAEMRQPTPAAAPSPPPLAPSYSTPAPASAPANGSAQIKHLDKDVQITAIALMKSYIETGKFGLTDLPMLEQACIPAAQRIVAASSR